MQTTCILRYAQSSVPTLLYRVGRVYSYPPPRVQFAPAPVDEGEITIATSANDTATIAGARW